MKALLFLTLRTLVNSVKRALTSPKRLLGLLFFGAYYFFLFVRPFDGRPRGPELAMGTRIQFPPLEVLEAAIFGLFGLLSIVLAFGTFSYRAAFKPADVDVLFPTPIPPRLVLVFRIVRDYLLTLLLPLAFLLLGFRATAVGLDVLFVNFPQYGGYVVRAAAIAWMLLALCWVCIGYAGSLFVNRSDLKSDLNKRVLTWSLAALLLGTFAFLFWRVQSVQGWADAVELARSPVLRVVIFPATAATALVMAPLAGSWHLALGGLGGLVLIIVLSLRVALTQVDWMYDQAAARGFATNVARQFQQQGDVLGWGAEQARQGKLKGGGLGWIRRRSPQGALALVWKDVILQLRGLRWMLVVVGGVVFLMSLMPAFVARGGSVQIAGYLLLAMQAFGAYMLGMGISQGGFLEVLRRVDLQKPLPFTPGAIVFYEVVSKTVIGILIMALSAVAAVMVAPALWPEALASIIVIPPTILLIAATALMMMVLFPDVDDPAQRAFRNLMLMLGIFMLMGPGVVAYLVLQFVLPPPIAAVPAAILCALLALGVSWGAGSLYAGYNPSE
jgi:hypothetical protein